MGLDEQKCSSNVHVGREEGGVTTSWVGEAVWFTFNWREYVPETEGLVSCSGDNALTVWTHREVKDSVGVTRERCNFLHGWVLPHDDLIQRIAMGADDLIHVLGKHQIAHLGTCVNAANWLESVGVPESDASICCATSWGQKTILMRAPTYSFYCSSVFREFH